MFPPLLLLALQLTPETLALHIHGAEVMPKEVYEAIVSLPAHATANEATADEVREQILTFLHRAGYELAEVRVAVGPHALEVVLDEGQLEKIVIRGKLTFQTLQFRLALVLPHDVFNRRELDREITELSAKLHVEGVTYALVPTRHVNQGGPQVDVLPQIQGFELVHPPRRYELQISFAEREWDTGLGLDVRSGFPDGVEVGGVYQGESLLLNGDRWRVAASLGGQLRQRIADNIIYPWPGRQYGEARWYAPPLTPLDLRPYVLLALEGISRQRPDLWIENYYFERAESSLNVERAFGHRLTLGLGGGAQYRRLFGVELSNSYLLPYPYPFPSLLGLQEQPRTFISVHSDLLFDDGGERADRRHGLLADARYFAGFGTPNQGEARAEYQKVWGYGWDDVWIKSKGAWLWGNVLFHDEEPLGRHLRGVFGSEYVHHAVSLSTEFRLSLSRDVLKASVFHDLALFGHLNRNDGTETLEIADSFGAGINALLQGMFQMDIYMAFGFASAHPPTLGPPQTNARFDTGLHADLAKVF